MIKIEIAGLVDVQTRLKLIATEQMPYAISTALNRVADRAKAAVKHEMQDVFDRPTPWTIGGVYSRWGDKRRQSQVVGLHDEGGKGVAPGTYLQAQMKGGGRRLKKFEVALRSVGVLPPNMYAVPGEEATIDMYGNMSVGQIVQILSYFRAFPEEAPGKSVGFKANMDAKGRKKLARGTKKKRGVSYFVGRVGDGRGQLGVWQRTHFAKGGAFGGGVSNPKPILIFVNRARYEAIFDFEYVIKHTVDKNFEAEFDAAWKHALATARSKGKAI